MDTLETRTCHGQSGHVRTALAVTLAPRDRAPLPWSARMPVIARTHAELHLRSLAFVMLVLELREATGDVQFRGSQNCARGRSPCDC